MVFFDVGSNVGYYTLLAAPLVGQSGQIHAFEPVAEQHADLRANLERNQLLNVVPERLILTDRADFAEHMVKDRRLPLISFTGSVPVGRAVRDEATARDCRSSRSTRRRAPRWSKRTAASSSSRRGA